jgi:hypothetical protein
MSLCRVHECVFGALAMESEPTDHGHDRWVPAALEIRTRRRGVGVVTFPTSPDSTTVSGRLACHASAPSSPSPDPYDSDRSDEGDQSQSVGCNPLQPRRAASGTSPARYGHHPSCGAFVWGPRTPPSHGGTRVRIPYSLPPRSMHALVAAMCPPTGSAAPVRDGEEPPAAGRGAAPWSAGS